LRADSIIGHSPLSILAGFQLNKRKGAFSYPRTPLCYKDLIKP